jgi:hypothetical protein
VSGAYPPEPWRLQGDLHTSVFLVPWAELSDVPAQLPPGCRPVRIGRFAVVGTAWASYRPGGVLSYDELMSTVLVRSGWRLAPTITHIWVDSVASRDGGRALWGIPKDLATFSFAGPAFAGRTDAGPIAAGTVGRLLALPGRLPVRFRIAQTLGGAAKLTRVRARARVALARATFTADPAGPLAFLAGRRALLSLSLLDFRMTFG